MRRNNTSTILLSPIAILLLLGCFGNKSNTKIKSTTTISSSSLLLLRFIPSFNLGVIALASAEEKVDDNPNNNNYDTLSSSQDIDNDIKNNDNDNSEKVKENVGTYEYYNNDGDKILYPFASLSVTKPSSSSSSPSSTHFRPPNIIQGISNAISDIITSTISGSFALVLIPWLGSKLANSYLLATSSLSSSSFNKMNSNNNNSNNKNTNATNMVTTVVSKKKKIVIIVSSVIAGLCSSGSIIAGGIVSANFQLFYGLYKTPSYLHHRYGNYNNVTTTQNNNKDENNDNTLMKDDDIQCFPLDSFKLFRWKKGGGSKMSSPPPPLLPLYELDLDYHILNRASTIKRKKMKVKDTRYYDLLGIDVNANRSEIQKGYRTAALATHPDKNVNDIDAESKFREVNTAYRILRDDDKRAKYDRRGINNNNDDESNQNVAFFRDNFDLRTFFAVIFASDAVEPYVGELRISIHVDTLLDALEKILDATTNNGNNGNNNGLGIDPADIERIFGDYGSAALLTQRMRVVDIARVIRDRVKTLATAPHAGSGSSGSTERSVFRVGCREEAEKIASSSKLGKKFLVAIGNAMIRETDHFLARHNDDDLSFFNPAKYMKQLFTYTKQSLLVRRQSVNIYHSIFQSIRMTLDSALMSLSTAEKYSSAGGAGGGAKVGMNYDQFLAQQRGVLSDAVQRVLWAYNVQDVTHTVQDAVHRLLMDTAVTMKERTGRARAVGILGREFRSVGISGGGGGVSGSKGAENTFESMDELMKRADVAYIKAQSQEA